MGSQKHDAGRTAQLVHTSFQGPIPPPATLEKYDQLIPGAADRILRMAEVEQAHRHDVNVRALDGMIREHRRGQCFGMILGVCGLCSAVIAAYLRQPWVAGILGGGTIVSLVSVFVRTKIEKPAVS